MASETLTMSISELVVAAIAKTSEGLRLTNMTDQEFEKYRMRIGMITATVKHAYYNGEKYIEYEVD